MKNIFSPQSPIQRKNIDYVMVGLGYCFYLQVTDVISRTSEVQATDIISVRSG